MRGLVLAAAGAIFFLSAVNAADIDQPYVPIFPWTGFYLGPNGGGGAGPSSFTSAVNENDFHIFRLGLNYQFNQCCEPLK